MACSHKFKLDNGDIMCDAPGMPDYLEYGLCKEEHPDPASNESIYPCEEEWKHA